MECTHGGSIYGGVYIWWNVHIVECTQDGVYTWWSVHIVECTNGGVYDGGYTLWSVYNRVYTQWSVHIVEFMACTHSGLYTW